MDERLWVITTQRLRLSVITAKYARGSMNRARGARANAPP
jgi:hypothetical protein